MKHRLLHKSVVTFCVLASLAGCRSSTVSLAEKEFVADLIPHHNVGITLLEIGQKRSADVRLRRLIFEMGDYHHSELHMLETYAQEWEVTPSRHFEGEVTEEELSQLRTSSGTQHDIKWLDVMIRHHQGALQISRRLISEDASQSLVTLARNIIAVQSNEIVEMIRLRKSKCVGSPTC